MLKQIILYLNTNAAADYAPDMWNDTAPTDAVFTVVQMEV